MNLRLDMRTAYETGFKEHPQTLIKNLGITYFHAVPQSVADQWWFFNCKNVPEQLPSFLTELIIENPMDYVGWGLSIESATAIIQDSGVSNN